MSKLISEPPLLVLRSLAVEFGLNEAIVLQQMHFLGQREEGGWVEKSLSQWRAVFPFWSTSTVERALAHLVTQQVAVREENAGRASRYRIDYTHRTLTGVPVNVTREAPQSEEGPRVREEENNKRGKKKRAGAQIIPTADEPIGFREWLEHYTLLTGRRVPAEGTTTRSDLARSFAALVGEGYVLEDFLAVSDFRVLDPYWAATDVGLAWCLRRREFGERAESGRALRAAKAEAAASDAVDWSRFNDA